MTFYSVLLAEGWMNKSLHIKWWQQFLVKNSGDKLRYYNGSCLKHQGVINPEKCILRFLKQVSEVNSVKEVLFPAELKPWVE